MPRSQKDKNKPNSNMVDGKKNKDQGRNQWNSDKIE